MKIATKWFVVLAVCTVFAGSVWAKGSGGKTSLAILDFVDGEDYVTDEGEKVALLTFAGLAGDENVRLIERASMAKVMKEHRLNASGLVNPKQSISFGKLLGAEYILTGRIYTLDKNVCFNGKLINCRTGKIKGISESYPEKQDRGAMMESFASKLAKYVSAFMKKQK